MHTILVMSEFTCKQSLFLLKLRTNTKFDIHIWHTSLEFMKYWKSFIKETIFSSLTTSSAVKSINPGNIRKSLKKKEKMITYWYFIMFHFITKSTFQIWIKINRYRFLFKVYIKVNNNIFIKEPISHSKHSERRKLHQHM